jgi:hypothetical protein
MTAGASALEAQIQRGNVMVGGDIANLQFSLNEGGNFNMQVDPKAAWFIRDNVALGGYLNLGLSTAKRAGTSISYGVGVLGRNYISGNALEAVRHTRLFFEANVGIEGFNPSVGSNTNGLGLGIGPGLAYFITPNIGLEALVKYGAIVGFGSAATSSNLNLAIGFQVYLPNRTLRNAARNTQ